MENKNEIVISDLTAFEPKSAISKTEKENCWLSAPYETAEGINGVMLFGDKEKNPPPLSLELNASGIYKIYLGLNYTRHNNAKPSSYGEIFIKLSGDLGYSRISREAAKGKNTPSNRILHNSVYELYYKTADLTGKNLSISVPHDPLYMTVSNLTYIRLVPLNEAEEKQWLAARERKDTKDGIMLWCTADITAHTAGGPFYHPTSEEWFKNEIGAFSDSDIGIICFEALRGAACCYKTRIGDTGSEDGVSYDESWLDPLEQFVKIGHENNMEVFSTLRLIGASYPMDSSVINRAKYYWKMRGFAKKDKDGTPGSMLSLAYPEVRRFWLSLLEETLEYGVDGIHVHLNRCYPFVGYEEPVVNDFIEKYGVDPRTLDYGDERYLKHAATYLTQFLREIRELLGRKPGRRLGITFVAVEDMLAPAKIKYYNIESEYYYIDIDILLKEKIVDILVPSPVCMGEQIKGWKALNPDIKIHPDLMPRSQPGESFAALMKQYYEWGADGYALWDGERRTPRASEWAVVRDLGHRDLLDKFIKEAPSYLRRIDLKTINGMSVRYSFTDG